MLQYDKRLVRPVTRWVIVTIAATLIATASAVTLATVVGILPEYRWLFELKVSAGIALVVSGLIAPIVIWKVMSIAQQLRDAKAELQKQAETDHLTGLLNRRGFEDKAAAAIERARAEGKPVALIAVDIDHFKQINDVHGHHAGDVVISSVAAAIRSTMEAEVGLDFAVGRMGGEEYSCLVVGLTQRSMMERAERIRNACNAVVVAYGGHSISATMSVGASIVSHRDVCLEQLMLSADRALYKAKETGRNKTAYHLAA